MFKKGNFSIILGMLLTIFLLVKVGAENYIIPNNFSDEEVSCLLKKEKSDMLNTEWGKAFKYADDLRSSIMKPQNLDYKELLNLKMLNDISLNKVIAAGTGTPLNRILWFFPDRILDCLDIVSLPINIGLWFRPCLHITRWCSLGFGGEVSGGILWFYNRNLAPNLMIGIYAMIGPYQAYTYDFLGIGTAWNMGLPGAGNKFYYKAGIFSMDDEPVVDGWMDPWGIGITPWDDIHPIEIADFISGLFTLGFYDLSGDDYANPFRSQYKIGLPVDVKQEKSKNTE